ncbi:hypothetical protein KEM55_005759 [Ascosphaera atra]|nr:hypothetical protein KEM55_005759 [Ascosphaera atra]
MSQSQTTSQAVTRRGKDTELMPPPPPPKRIKRPAQVLEEDKYTEALSHIIARDFFPGLLETEAQQEYLDALQSKDKAWIAKAGQQLEQVMTPGPKGRRGVSMTPRTQREIGTPAATPKGWGGDTPVSVAPDSTPAASEAGSSTPQTDPDLTNLSLGAFQAKYTSEDNESFNRLLTRQNTKKRERYAWIWNDNKIPSARQIAHRKQEQKRIEAQPTTASDADKQLIKTDFDARPARPDAWKFKPRNALMFEPDSIEDELPTKQQQAEEISRFGPKQIVLQNTRVPSSLDDEEAGRSRPPSPTQSAIRDAIAGRPRRTESDAGFTGGETPRVNGYAFVDEDEPEPELSADAKHDDDYYMKLMTSQGVDAAPNPFTIKENRKREDLLHRMVDRVAKSKRSERSYQTTKTPVPKFPSSPMIAFGRTPGTVGGGGATGASSSASKAALTPAARRLWQQVGNNTSRAGATPSSSSSAAMKDMWTPTPKRKK